MCGLLDFGDCLRAPTVCELAIALAYGMLDLEDPLERGADLVAGYHEEHPLSIPEAEVLFPLVCGRLASTVAVAAARRQIDPNQLFVALHDLAWNSPAHGQRKLLHPAGGRVKKSTVCAVITAR